MSYYAKHVFFCCNQRDGGRTCCNDKGATQMRDYAKGRIKDLGLAGELDCSAVARPVACQLGPDERDRCADRGEHLRMLGPDQRPLQPLGHERYERLACAPQRDERHVRRAEADSVPEPARRPG